MKMRWRRGPGAMLALAAMNLMASRAEAELSPPPELLWARNHRPATARPARTFSSAETAWAGDTLGGTH